MIALCGGAPGPGAHRARGTQIRRESLFRRCHSPGRSLRSGASRVPGGPRRFARSAALRTPAAPVRIASVSRAGNGCGTFPSTTARVSSQRNRRVLIISVQRHERQGCGPAVQERAGKPLTSDVSLSLRPAALRFRQHRRARSVRRGLQHRGIAGALRHGPARRWRRTVGPSAPVLRCHATPADSVGGS